MSQLTEFVPHSIEPFSGTAIPRSAFVVASSCNEASLPALFDGSTSTYFQTEETLPHRFLFRFGKPRHLTCIAIFRDAGDGSFLPKNVKVITKSADGQVLMKTRYELPQQTGWSFFPVPPRKAGFVKLKVLDNFNGGRDSRLRLIEFYANGAEYPALSRIRHDALFHTELATGADDDLALTAGDEEMLVSAFLFAVHFPRLAACAKDGRVDLGSRAELLVPLGLFVANDLCGAADAARALPADPDVPDDVYQTLGGIATLLEFARANHSATLLAFCEDTAAADITRAGATPELMSWVRRTSERLACLAVMTAVRTGPLKEDFVGTLSTAQLASALEAIVQPEPEKP